MWLNNLRIMNGPSRAHLHISGKKLLGISQSAGAGGSGIDMSGALAFPGLINSHDHLGFNLFPQLGAPVYSNYLDWGADIHQRCKKEISEILAIPASLRTKWGIYKNLLNGVTTVVHHGEKLQVLDSPIHILSEAQSLHSVGREKAWRWKLINPINLGRPVAIHIGEGVDAIAAKEVDRLLSANILRRRIIAVHGVAMKEEQAKAISALVWCPASNLFLLGKTASVDLLKKNCPILFGTDSTLSAGWDIWKQLREAAGMGLLSFPELFESLTTAPAQTWGLPGKGRLVAGADADIVVAETSSTGSPYQDFFAASPEGILLVVCSGEVVMYDERIRRQLEQFVVVEQFQELQICGRTKLLKGKPADLIVAIREACPGIHIPGVD